MFLAFSPRGNPGRQMRRFGKQSGLAEGCPRGGLRWAQWASDAKGRCAGGTRVPLAWAPHAQRVDVCAHGVCGFHSRDFRKPGLSRLPGPQGCPGTGMPGRMSRT